MAKWLISRQTGYMSSYPNSILLEKGPSSHQEDAVFFDPDLRLHIVCDGLGIKGSGAEASSLAISVLEREVRKECGAFQSQQFEDKEERKNFLNRLESIFQSASKAIFDKAKQDKKFAGMCSSVDLFLQVGSHGFLGHVGAGRMYLLRAGELHQLTEDHTQLAQFRRLGKLDGVPEVQHGALAKRLTRAIGFHEEVKVDFLELELQEADQILLCTDGVWQCFKEGELEKELDSLDPAKSISRIQTRISERGARDNFSALAFLPPLAREQLAESSADLKIKFTGKISLFRYLSYQELIKVVSVAELFKVNEGAILCREGELGAEAMIVLSGSVDVVKSSQTIAKLGKGELFGEMSMLDTAPRSATIRAAEASSLLAFPRDALFKLLREEPVLCTKFLWGLSQELNKRLRHTSNKLVGKEIDLSPERTGGLLPFFYSKEIR